MTIAFVGLGRMGLPMASNLSNDDREVIGVDVDVDRRAAFEEAGGRTERLSEAASEADVVFTMLRTPAQVEQVTDDLFSHLEEGTLLVNTSTSGPEIDLEVAATAREAGVRMLDAPVSGGVEGAEDGTLAIMVGGQSDDLAEVRPLLDTLGEDIFHVGDVGAGQTAKLCNQLLVGAELLSISEAFHLGEAADIDPETLYDVLTSCIGSSGILEQKGERLIDGDFEPGADVNLQHKDSQLILDLAEETDTPTYLASVVAQVFVHARQAGLGERDHFAVYELFEER